MPRNVSDITQTFIRAYKTKLSRKIIGELYRYRVELRGHTTNYIKAKWKKELGIVIGPEEWTNIINTQVSTTASNKSPNRPDYNSSAGEDVVTVWHTIHTYSGAASLNPSGKVFTELREVLRYDIKFTCLSFYLGNRDLELP